ncbi:hypothetical protein Adt_28178 [Abeliophyllum distichum]|uniref:Uncharacterized protein n=1 Tax=Abeliophyllum distichum TaxID=126358 RepID=A0ABD1RVT6_9LAMI
MRYIPIPTSLSEFVQRNIYHWVNLRTPSTLFQAGAFSSRLSHAKDYQDADPDEHKDSNESTSPVDVPNCQPDMNQDEMCKVTSSERKSSIGLTQAIKKKSGHEIISASINNLVSWGR